MKLTYCTNIHPADGWKPVFSSLLATVPRIAKAMRRDSASTDDPFPLCLWLSALSVSDVTDAAVDEFCSWCAQNRVEVVCLNGFPYGAFHANVVKQGAYLPDWRSPERLAYTCALADFLARCLPTRRGVITTVPVGFGSLADASEGWQQAYGHILKALEYLDGLAQRSSKQIVLAFEPEPGCVLQTVDDVLAFVDGLRVPAALVPYFGVCYDCCHQAVQFETAGESLARLTNAGVQIAAMHLSAALCAPGGSLSCLASFNEPKYLHQTVARMRDGRLQRFVDLGDALEAGIDGDAVDQWRVHFHVPIDTDRVQGCETTQPQLREALAWVARTPGALPADIPLVVETYSLAQVPGETKQRLLGESVVRELTWARRELTSRCSTP